MISLSSYTKFLWMGDYGLKNILQDGRIEVYGGTRPDSADSAVSGPPLLGTITQNGDPFVANQRSGGALKIQQTGYGVLSQSGKWRLTVITDGTATWFRYHGNYADSNAEDTNYVHIRLDGDVGTTGDLVLTTNELTQGEILPVNFYLHFRNL